MLTESRVVPVSAKSITDNIEIFSGDMRITLHCGCWAHVRRKFYEALPLDEEIKKTSRANAGFERINQLFALERE